LILNVYKWLNNDTKKTLNPAKREKKHSAQQANRIQGTKSSGGLKKKNGEQRHNCHDGEATRSDESLQKKTHQQKPNTGESKQRGKTHRGADDLISQKKKLRA